VVVDVRARALHRVVAAAAALVVTMAIAPAAGAQSRVDLREAIPYATHSGVELLLDAYLPAGDGPFPAVVVIPGGRWQRIDRHRHSDVPDYFAEHGVAAFAIDYRSSYQYPYPAAVEDVTAAVEWVRTNAADYGVDPAQLGAVGVSAGGHLAALVAAMESGDDRLNVVASFSGPMDLVPLLEAEDTEVRDAVHTFLGCSGGAACEAAAREASPLTYVDPTDPPMLLVNSKNEVIPTDQPTAMWSALREADVQSIAYLIEGGHGSGYGGSWKVMDRVFPFVQTWLTGAEVPTLPGEDGFNDGEGDGATDSRGQEGEQGGQGESSGGKETRSPAPAGAESPRAETGTAGSRGGTLDALTVATAMVALLLVAVLLFVVVRLRRRIAVLSQEPPSSPSTVEQT
jgi:acetyl esterase/lipase